MDVKLIDTSRAKYSWELRHNINYNSLILIKIQINFATMIHFKIVKEKKEGDSLR